MKNYELMNILSGLPSGMEIVTSGIVGCSDIINRETVDKQDGEVMYSLAFKVTDAKQGGGKIHLLLNGHR